MLQLGPNFPAQNTERLPMANPPPPTNHSQYVGQGYTADVNRFFSKASTALLSRQWIKDP